MIYRTMPKSQDGTKCRRCGRSTMDSYGAKGGNLCDSCKSDSERLRMREVFHRDERAARIRVARSEGKTWAEIATAEDVSIERVRQIGRLA